MSAFYRCPLGHLWDGSRGEAPALGGGLCLCPVCGGPIAEAWQPAPDALVASDLARVTGHKPTRAQSVRLGERAGRWARRCSTATVAFAAAALLTVGLLTDATVSAYARQRRLTGLRAEVQERLAAVRAALATDHPEEASALLSDVVARIDSQPALADLRREAEQLEEMAREHREAHASHATFVRLGAEALFGAALLDGAGAPGRLQSIRAVVEQALAGVASPGPLNPRFSAAQALEVREGSYDLLLVLAEAVAQPLPGEPLTARQQRGRAALAVLERAARLGLRTHAYHLRRAHYLAQAGDETAACRERARAHARPPATDLDHYLMGAARYRGGDAQEARRHLRQALLLQPRNFWALYYLALCSVRLAGRDPAPGYLLEAARDHLTNCESLRPGAVWVSLTRGCVQARLGQYPAAHADFAAAEKLLQDRPNARAGYALLVERAVASLAEKRFADAERDLQRAIRLRPGQYQAHHTLVEVCVRREDLRAALLHSQKAIRAAKALRAKEEVDDHTLACLYRLRGGLQFRRQNLSGARRELGHVLALRGLSHAGRAQAHLERAQLLAHSGRHADALADYEEVIRRQPANAAAYLGRGLARLGLGRLAGAVADADEGVRRAPDSQPLVYGAAGLLAQAAAAVAATRPGEARAAGVPRRYEERAVGLLRQALQLLPPAERADFWRGTVGRDPRFATLRRNASYLRLGRLFGRAPAPRAGPG